MKKISVSVVVSIPHSSIYSCNMRVYYVLRRKESKVFFSQQTFNKELLSTLHTSEKCLTHENEIIHFAVLFIHQCSSYSLFMYTVIYLIPVHCITCFINFIGMTSPYSLLYQYIYYFFYHIYNGISCLLWQYFLFILVMFSYSSYYVVFLSPHHP